MNIEDMRVFAETNAQAMAPLKSIIKYLIFTLILITLLFCGTVGYMVKKMYEEPTGTSISANDNYQTFVTQNMR